MEQKNEIVLEKEIVKTDLLSQNIQDYKEIYFDYFKNTPLNSQEWSDKYVNAVNQNQVNFIPGYCKESTGPGFLVFGNAVQDFQKNKKAVLLYLSVNILLSYSVEKLLQKAGQEGVQEVYNQFIAPNELIYGGWETITEPLSSFLNANHELSLPTAQQKRAYTNFSSKIDIKLQNGTQKTNSFCILN